MAGGVAGNNREAIRYLLSLEPRMTGEQIARLLPYGENGEELKPFKPRADRDKTFPGSYPKIMDMLKRMKAAGEVMCFRENEAQAFIWMRKSDNLKFPSNWYNRQHELACGDLFGAFYLTGKLDHWDNKWTKDEIEYYRIKETKVYYDRRMVVNEKVFFWEVDRGTEDGEQLEDKINKYVAFARAYPKDRFFVLFSMQGSRYYNLDARVKWMLKLLGKRASGYQFLVAEHAAAIATPLEAIFTSSQDPEPVSLLDLDS